MLQVREARRGASKPLRRRESSAIFSPISSGLPHKGFHLETGRNQANENANAKAVSSRPNSLPLCLLPDIIQCETFRNVDLPHYSGEKKQSIIFSIGLLETFCKGSPSETPTVLFPQSEKCVCLEDALTWPRFWGGSIMYCSRLAAWCTCE